MSSDEAHSELKENSNRGVALVTGSSSGIGASVAVDLASIGYTVILTGRNASNLADVEQKCNAALKSSGSSARAIPYQIDFNNLEELDKLVCFVRSNFNKLNVLVNNVCFRGEIKSILTEDVCDDLQRTLHMNVLVPMRLVLDCLMPNSDLSTTSAVSSPASKAIVINVSSIAAQISVPLHAYSISKACLSELSRQLALFGDESGILSVAVSPGPVLTDERPHHAQMSRCTLMGRVGSTQEISDIVLFLIDKAHLFNGQEVNIDGGYMGKQKQM